MFDAILSLVSGVITCCCLSYLTWECLEAAAAWHKRRLFRKWGLTR